MNLLDYIQEVKHMWDMVIMMHIFYKEIASILLKSLRLGDFDLFYVHKTADSQRPQSKPSNDSYPWKSPNYRLCFHAIFHKLITSFQSSFILKLMNP